MKCHNCNNEAGPTGYCADCFLNLKGPSLSTLPNAQGESGAGALLRRIIIEWERQKRLFPDLLKDGWMQLLISEAATLLNNTPTPPPCAAQEGPTPRYIPCPLTETMELHSPEGALNALPVVSADFARNLERQLAESRAEFQKANEFRERLRFRYRQVCDECDQLSSAVDQLREENLRLKAKRQWQPIETCDKDGIRMLHGRRVIGWCAEWDDVFIVKWSPDRGKPHWTTDDGAVVEHAPTHWMPLPAAQTQEERA